MKRTFDGLRAILGDVNPAAPPGDHVDNVDSLEPPPASADREASEPGGNPDLDLQLRAPSPIEQDSTPLAAGVAAETPAAVLEEVAQHPGEGPRLGEVPKEELRSREIPEEELPSREIPGEGPRRSEDPLAMQSDASGSELPELADPGQSEDALVDDLGLLDLDRGVYDGDSPAGPAEIRAARGAADAPVPLDAEPAAEETPAVDRDLLDLDHGLFDGDRAAPPSDLEGLDDLDFSAQPPEDSPQRGVDREPALQRPRTDSGTSQPPPLSARLVHPDNGKTPFAEDDGPPVHAQGILMGHVNEWTAAIVLILSMFLGASAAVAVFHERVSQIFVRLG